VIQNNSEPWLTTEGRSYPSILRRDCAQIQTEDGCSGGCTWTEGRCLIHTTATPRFVNPIQVLTVRLVDELLRTFSAAEELLKQKVPYLRPITSRDFIQEKDAVLFTAKGRGDDALYEKLGYARRQPSEFTMGFTFPEEIRIPDDVTVGYLPTEWTFYLRQAIVGATASRDKRDTLFTVLLSLADTQLMAYEAERGRPITGTEEDWAFLAKKLETEVILTQYNAITKTIAPVKWLQGQTAAGAAAPPRRFIILDAEGIPLQRIKDGGFVSLQQELPGLIQAWLDTNMPV
jgi:hypothetical protein